jgi:hypothetical protein
MASDNAQRGDGRGAADERIEALLARWLASIDLHAGYLALDDDAYAKVQSWPKHQRPSRWVIELARTRLVELRRRLAARRTAGDAGFAEALELMSFLTTLLGTENLDRFIPLAEPPAAARPRASAPRAPRRTQAASTAKAPAAAIPAKAPAAAPEATPKATATVVADAVRLLAWGREWPQLAGLIARLAGRPPEAEVWRILRKHRATIESRAKRKLD